MLVAEEQVNLVFSAPLSSGSDGGPAWGRGRVLSRLSPCAFHRGLKRRPVDAAPEAAGTGPRSPPTSSQGWADPPGYRGSGHRYMDRAEGRLEPGLSEVGWEPRQALWGPSGAQHPHPPSSTSGEIGLEKSQALTPVGGAGGSASPSRVQVGQFSGPPEQGRALPPGPQPGPQPLKAHWPSLPLTHSLPGLPVWAGRRH